MMQANQQMQTQMMTAMMMIMSCGDHGVGVNMMPVPFAGGALVVTGETTVVNERSDKCSKE